jgi:hypothetical protein
MQPVQLFAKPHRKALSRKGPWPIQQIQILNNGSIKVRYMQKKILAATPFQGKAGVAGHATNADF